MDTEKLFGRLKKVARAAGRGVMIKALTLWHCMKDKDTPSRIKAVIVGDLLYLVSPLDAVPDMIPGVGFTDDVAVITLALAVLAAHIKPEHHEKAAAKIDEWF